MKSSHYNLFIPSKKGYAAFNTLTGSILFVDEELKEIIQEGTFDQLEKEKVDTLKKTGFIIDDAVDETQIMSFRQKALTYSHINASFSVLPTYACNLACPYCYEGRGEIHRGSMSKEMTEQIINGIKNYCLQEGVHNLGLTLYGGEPLLHKTASLRLVSALGEWAPTVGITFNCNMITNGTLLTKDALSQFQPYVRMIQVTLDGPQHYHDTRRIQKTGEGTYELTMNAVKTAREHDILVRIRIQVAKDNVTMMDDLFKDLVNRGIHKDPGVGAYTFPLMDINDVCSSYASLCSEEETKLLPGLWRKAREYGLILFSKPVQTFVSPYCSFATKNSFLVDALGDVYKCVSVVGEKEYRVGYMSEHGLTDISPVLYAFMVRDPLTLHECADCVLLPLCNGGCAHRAYQKHHTYQASDCVLHKGLEEEKLQLYLETKYKDRFG